MSGVAYEPQMYPTHLLLIVLAHIFAFWHFLQKATDRQALHLLTKMQNESAKLIAFFHIITNTYIIKEQFSRECDVNACTTVKSR